ncbi:hypothetical protein K5X82_07345 [Halosquirtibacter xylanolyticus]|uniref:hypothetical protein n=1 Tax=Halosquirtibacter xylanolyticus TaxID=3374599 RepID=UPI003749FE9C|nr:hypothetical protein K5X82_07345 [Prolixibacteraceae bacterium]
MKIDELKIERAQKTEELENLLKRSEKENRDFSEEEETQYDNLRNQVRSLNKKIERMEEVNTFSRSYLPHKRGKGEEGTDDDDEEDDDDEKKKPKRSKSPSYNRNNHQYDVSKAIREYSRNASCDALTGLEAETHQELQRNCPEAKGLLIPTHARAHNTGNHAGTLDVVQTGLSIIAPEPLYRMMGCTILEGVHGVLKLSKASAATAETKNEGEAITQGINKPESVTLSPIRYGVSDKWSQELLSQENPAVHAALLNDMYKACDRKITEDVFAKAKAAAREVTAAFDEAGFNKLMSEVELPGAFAMSRNLFFKGKAIKFDEGSGRRLLEIGKQNGVGLNWEGVGSFYTSLFKDAAKDKRLLYGAWSEMWVGLWSGLEVLINPYTYQKNGETEITVNRLANMAVRNNAAFVKSTHIEG